MFPMKRVKSARPKPARSMATTARAAGDGDLVKRNYTEKGFLQSEERFRLLFEKSSDPILLLDGDVFVDCNEAALKCMHCCNRDQLIGLRPWDISPNRQPDGRLSSRKGAEIIRQTLEKGTNRFEWLHRAFDGEELWMDVALTVIPINKRQVMYTMWRDITERKRAEEALSISRIKLSEAMDLARIVYWEADLKTGEFIFNDPFYAFCGTTAEREGGYRMSREEYAKRFVHPDDMPLFERAREKRSASRGLKFENDMEHRIVRRDGEVRHVLARIHVERDATGRISRYYGANQDITERRQTARALLESEERYRIAIENSNDGVAIIKGEQHVYVNPKFLAMFGYDHPGEILGTRVNVTVHPDDREKVIEIHRKRERGEVVPSRHEFRGVRSDGTLIGVEISAARIVYQGEPATLVYLRDITERQRAQEQLRQFQKMEAIGTLSAGIAHDFKNILTAIRGFANLGIKHVQDGSKPKWYLDRIYQAVERGKELVGQILAFSYKGEDEPRPVELIPVVRESVRMLRASLHPTIEIRESFTTDSSLVLADPAQVQQIIMNLATNAAYAMAQKGGALSIELSDFSLTSQNAPTPGMTAGPYLKLSISDTGTGMDAQTMERVFDPFFTTKKRTEGTGLGLWVVHSIVTKYRGAITVRSAPGEGSTFDVLLPRIID
jgi:PAS domain S-box-containing protein